MNLYLGSRDYKPDGFLTVDVDPTHKPDIVADVCDLRNIASASVDEVCASHILEHLAWPISFRALAEWARVLRPGGVLRVAVPDVALMAAYLARGRNVWTAMGLLYGVGRIANKLEGHQYGYTQEMLLDMFEALGLGQFKWWKHDMPDASNGWMFDDNGHKIAVSLNIHAEKIANPIIDPRRVLENLIKEPLEPFDKILARTAGASEVLSTQAERSVLLTQNLHVALTEARMRIAYLENQLKSLSAAAG